MLFRGPHLLLCGPYYIVTIVLYDVIICVDKEAMVDDAVLMEPPLSGSLTKTSSFTEEGTL